MGQERLDSQNTYTQCRLTMLQRGSIFFLSALAVIAAIAWLTLRRNGSVSSQALSVSFVGYTNLPAGETAAVFVVSNQWNVTIKRWAAACLEVGPFASDSSPTQWKMAAKFLAADSYLKPGQTERLLIGEI